MPRRKQGDIAEEGSGRESAGTVLAATIYHTPKNRRPRQDSFPAGRVVRRWGPARVSHEAVRSSPEPHIAFLKREVKRLESVIESAVPADEATRTTPTLGSGGLIHSPDRTDHSIPLVSPVGRATSTSITACSRPARGPESKSMATRRGPTGWADGTRTEAGQKVPQVNPDRVVASGRPSRSASTISAPGPSSPSGEVDVPR